MQMKVQRHSHKRRRSLLTEECSLAIGNTSSLKRTTSVRETKVAGDGYLGLDESMDITTVTEQGVQWDFTNVEMRNQAFRKTVAEKPFLLMGSHPRANWRPKSDASWTRMTQRERKMTSCTEPEYTCSLFVACTSCSTMRVGTSCMNTAWRKDCVQEIQEMTGAKLMSVRRRNCNLPSNEKPTVMVTNCPAIAFALRVSAKARLLNKRYSERLERNEHKSIEDLHEDISFRIRLQHRQHK